MLTVVGAVDAELSEPRKNGGKAEEVDTEHMFGLITGTDIGQAGEKEVESETTGRLGKRTGSYTALSHMLALEYTPMENLRLEMGAINSYHDVSGVAELDNLRRGAFEGLSIRPKADYSSIQVAGGAAGDSAPLDAGVAFDVILECRHDADSLPFRECPCSPSAPPPAGKRGFFLLRIGCQIDHSRCC
jgi:hypothetical protein